MCKLCRVLRKIMHLFCYIVFCLKSGLWPCSPPHLLVQTAKKTGHCGASGRAGLEWTRIYFVSQRKWGQTIWKMDE